MEQNEEYIVKYKNSDHRKVQVLEVTEYTYYLRNLDANVKFRITKKEFEDSYKVVEKLDTKLHTSDTWDWADITRKENFAARNMLIHTGRGGAILQQEVVLGRSLTQEEKDEFKDGIYELSTSGTKYLGKYE